MLTAFYYTVNGKVRKFPEVSKHVSAYMDWEPDTPATRRLPPGKRLLICLNIGWQGKTAAQAIADAIKYLRGDWGRIAVLELADEPGWTAAECNANARTVKAAIKAAGLPAKPIGVTFTYPQVMMGQSWKAPELDWVGVEAYIPYKAGESAAAAAKRLRAVIDEQCKRVAQRKVVLIGQAYNRNGTWPDVPSLVALQRPTFEAAKALGSRLVALTLFAYVRPGGTRDIPPLKAELFRLLDEFDE